MITLLKKLYRKTANRLRYYAKTSGTVSQKTGEAAVIIHYDARLMRYANGRHVYIASKYFQYAGYKVFVKADAGYFSANITYKNALQQEPVSWIRDASTPVNSITLANADGSRQQIKITYGDSIRKDDFDCMAPYPMHPLQYHSPTSAHLMTYRAAPRNMRLFFAGNVDEKVYNNDVLERRFGVISRYAVVKHIKQQFGAHINTVTTQEELQNLMTAQLFQKAIVISEARTSTTDWLKLLSKADFFIGPPGVQIPWCHNVVESMAVGTIPILQYGHLFDPKLVHLENCLRYNSLDELEQVLNLALQMDPAEIKRMQKAAVAYFDNYLSIESVLERIKTFAAAGKKDVTMGIPFILDKTK